MTYPPGQGGQWPDQTGGQPQHGGQPHADPTQQQQYPGYQPQGFGQPGQQGYPGQGFPGQEYQGQGYQTQGFPQQQYGYALPPEQPKKSRKGLVIGVVGAVLAVAAGAGVTVWAINQGSVQAGAESPTAAATSLVSALGQGDVAGLLSGLAPAERDLLTSLNAETTKELQRLEVYKADVDPNKVEGFELTTKDLVFDEAAAERVNDHLTITKLVSGTVTVTSDASKLPYTEEFLDTVFPRGVPGGKKTETIDIAKVVREENKGEPIRIATVQDDGEWYPSMLYTIADYALADEKQDWPATPIPAVGGDSPEAAVRGFTDAALAGDVEGVIKLLPPDEMGVLHDVGPAIVDAAGRTEDSGARLVDLQTETEGVSGGTKVLLKSVTLDIDGERGTVTKDGDCYSADTPDGKEQICADDLAAKVGGKKMASDAKQALANLIKGMMANTGVITTEVDGKWYVSPIRTFTELELTALKSLQPEDIRALLKLAK
ncbi:hypothetical protein [Actinokineospora bangkokensis]|uniref:Flagellar basal body protein FliL n=1 Tax=Actinokineospora bangkokensis TaxID=1193682 RepID=A0A1Q9LRE4_9PSEU|nr:hypothetical protein [Actinokineospora bangkokensis]OLR94561.1 hypothetical protein BJP25_12545 [Actinokineospora bangkokensis]